MRTFTFLISIFAFLSCSSKSDVVFQSNMNVRASIGANEAQVVHTAFDIFAKDYKKVFGGEVSQDKDGLIIIGTLGDGSNAEKIIDKQSLKSSLPSREGYIMLVNNGKLYILGSDKRGTAYGILELSRMMGVSPWKWWADSHVAKRDALTLKDGFIKIDSPSVAHRGIFINDEDWGLMPWSYQTNEPSEVKGEIGPKTHARIFELLLRLRANTFWPAMHDCSVAFYMTPGNKEMADKYGIFIGSSHCEPMARNTNAEWRTAGEGTYDYVNNRESVLKFWEERVQELEQSDNIYTLGIRGVHDSKMLGAKTLEEQKDALEKVLKDQREMISKHVNPDVEQVSQVFIPYKEVLDVYNMGFEVSEDVSLMWCDDNYGYIRHFPNEVERARKGGNGVYYHISYWGRPHDYLWLTTNHPAQVYTQMKLAYDKGARDMWILNVGDIKPAEYLTELFLDMAWNIEAIENNQTGLDNHLKAWLSREFSNEHANELLHVMNEYYRLAYIRKPEFMANTRTEEKDPKYKVATDLPWSENEINERLRDYRKISKKVIKLSEKISPENQSAWFQLVEYPVRGAAEMNKKHLYAQLARHGKASWQTSDDAYDMIVSLTEKYNALENGKWRHMMDFQPRRLSVFDRVPQTKATQALPEHKTPLVMFNGKDYTSFIGERPITYGLGYQRGAINIAKGSTVTYNIQADKIKDISIEVALAPNHPVEGTSLRYAIKVDDEEMQEIDFSTQGRSEEWKENVLNNQAKRTSQHRLKNNKENIHKVTISALDEGVVLDQIKIWKR